jgi:flagellar biosynthetic protein FliS
MDAATTANTYKTQQIMTAPREELTLMLYNGAIRFANESIQHLEAKKLEKAHNANKKAQNIVRELMVTLDMQYDIAKELYALYDYIVYSLIQGNVKKDKTMIINARMILVELRDAWTQAMKQSYTAPAVGHAKSVCV